MNELKATLHPPPPTHTSVPHQKPQSTWSCNHCPPFIANLWSPTESPSGFFLLQDSRPLHKSPSKLTLPPIRLWRPFPAVYLSFLDLISRSKDIDRKKRLSVQTCRVFEGKVYRSGQGPVWIVGVHPPTCERGSLCKLSSSSKSYQTIITYNHIDARN